MKPRFLLLLWFALAGCTPQAPPAIPAPAPAAPAAPSGPGSTAATPAGPPATPVVPPRPFDETILRGREFLWETRPADTPVRDPVIGPLGRDPGLESAVDRFFRGVAAGSLDPALLAPRWSAYLEGWAGEAKVRGLEVEVIRVGIPLPEAEGETLVPVRLRGATSDQAGWVALERSADQWLIDDVQLNPTEGLTLPWDPESQGQEISMPNRR